MLSIRRRMAEAFESLDPAAIRGRLRDEIGVARAERFDLRVVAETGSTNDDVARDGETGMAEGRVLFAESQTAGRGRRGDAWVSPPGVNLLFSLLLRPEAPLATWVRIPHLAGIAICRGIENALPDLPEPLQLKWPNDLYLGGRKLGGILIESRSGARTGEDRPFAVLGVGINVNLPVTQFPEALRPFATSLVDHAGRVLSRNEIAAAILAEWSVIYPSTLAEFDPILTEVASRSFLLNREISVWSGGREIIGVVRGLGPDGELQLKQEGNPQVTTIRSADLVRLTRDG